MKDTLPFCTWPAEMLAFSILTRISSSGVHFAAIVIVCPSGIVNRISKQLFR